MRELRIQVFGEARIPEAVMKRYDPAGLTRTGTVLVTYRDILFRLTVYLFTT